MIKKILFALTLTTLLALQVSAASVLDGKIIGLDAGHGNGTTGAIGACGSVNVIEADVNLAVRTELTKLIEDNTNGTVHPIARLSTRKDRVADAEANGSDILISIHHNGSSDTSVDYTKSFVTQKNDRELAKVIHPKLVSVFGPDKGIKNDGYGMTVYGSLPGVLTESYFITNTNNACDFLDYEAGVANTMVHQEAQAMYDGLLEYFSQSGGDDDGNGGGKPDKCSPWPSCRN